MADSGAFSRGRRICSMSTRNQTTTWVQLRSATPNKLFGLLAVIDFTWAMIVLFLERHELEGLDSGLLEKVDDHQLLLRSAHQSSTWFPARSFKASFQIGQQLEGFRGI